jgi:predicted MFS family arabinose efflux permease
MAGRIDRRNALLGLSALLLIISTMICALADSFWLMLVGHDRARAVGPLARMPATSES